MPAATSKRKASLVGGRGTKRKSSTIASKQSSRVTKKPSTRHPQKKVRKVTSTEDEGSDNDSDSDFKSEISEAEEDDGEVDDEDEPQSYSIPLPKARDAGATPYEDHRIHPNTFLFLKDLKANNNREWLKWHDKDFRTSQRDFESFITKLTELIMEKDPTIPELPAKDIIFRIYRDIRFSPDPTPYKPHFSAAWSRTGKKGPYAAYYLQVQPGESFVGGGLWHPDGPALATIREDIDLNPQNIKGALMSDHLRRTFFEKASKDEKKVVAAFVVGNQEGALKTKPKGFAADHNDINLLKLRNFTMGKKIKDEQVLNENGINTIADIIGAMAPWITYLNGVVMPDPPTVDSSDDSA